MKEKIIVTICFILITVFTVLIIRYEPLLSTDAMMDTSNTTNVTDTVNTNIKNTTSSDVIIENTLENIVLENKETKSEYYSIIKNAYNDNNTIYGVKPNGETVKLAETFASFKNLDVYNNTLYYVDNNYDLHTVSLDGKITDTNLNIKLNSNLWNYSVCGSKLILFANGEEFYQEIYDLNTKQVKPLPFTNGNNEYFYNDKFYYTDRTTYTLSSYDVNTENIKEIAKNARILMAKDNIMLYESSDKLYKYNTTLDKSEELEIPKQYFSSSPNPMVLTDNNVYLIDDNYSLCTYDKNNKLTKLVDLKNEDYSYVVLNIFAINNDKILIAENCFGEIDVPEGFGYEEITSNKYIYTISTNKLEKTTDKKYDFFSAENDLDIIYVK